MHFLRRRVRCAAVLLFGWLLLSATTACARVARDAERRREPRKRHCRQGGGGGLGSRETLYRDMFHGDTSAIRSLTTNERGVARTHVPRARNKTDRITRPRPRRTRHTILNRTIQCSCTWISLYYTTPTVACRHDTQPSREPRLRAPQTTRTWHGKWLLPSLELYFFLPPDFAGADAGRKILPGFAHSAL